MFNWNKQAIKNYHSMPADSHQIFSARPADLEKENIFKKFEKKF
jgi:hypothetical protein